MEHLWAPWRNNYIQSEKKDTSNLFFDIGMSNEDDKNFVVYRSKSTFAVLNRYPYNAGHLLVLPYRKASHLSELGQDELIDLWTSVQKMADLLQKTFNPNGLNIGMNIGSSAGAGIPEHIHVHIVPRWMGDTNFMTVVDETRVHPSDLAAVYTKLKAAQAA